MFTGALRIAVTVILIMSLVGCGNMNNRTTDDQTYKAKSYPSDGLLGATSVNPNDPLNPTYHHYEDDSNLMKAVLAQLPGIDTSSITINGPVARVKVKPKPDLTDAQVDELRSQVQMALDTNMPRYDVRVRMIR
ncbi:hypothetical protein [Paenibacillus sedimenti]|uniref:Sporulation protein n=1 Tax=Paenibacillus sedimenti TaxID=2770274 RepID=A0A926KQ11_9BACL|nr:hypothetical protein [Paenibacillus sedimenti]MBD0381932.1 hypothetical protein [Paenibacillus sedimenti]